MSRYYFTVEEVERILPKVKRHMEKLMTIHDELLALTGVKVHAYSPDLKAQILAININKRYHELSFKYFAELETLTRMGCYVKDVSQGLVDFYTKMGGKDLLLCWQYDESEVLYFHDEDSGFNGRQPIALLKERLADEQRALL
ncbi:MAG: DUF2203 domain-containing protein [Candidatus Diapherotrites archaeon]|nr:DUF2203 domain-containing protein [Candidatus Diapherotrites archaeon]MDZ4256715.1 DUF2203 domain-containing protein [archaeon]